MAGSAKNDRPDENGQVKQRDSERDVQSPAAEPFFEQANGRKRENWQAEITRTFEEAAVDLEGTTERKILGEIKRYRAQRRSSQ